MCALQGWADLRFCTTGNIDQSTDIQAPRAKDLNPAFLAAVGPECKSVLGGKPALMTCIPVNSFKDLGFDT